MIAREMAYLLDKKIRDSNAMINLDMMKAYDCVNWQFLTHLLAHFCFDSWFISLIFNHLKGTYISILINGVPTGFFQPTPVVKQGVPLSPLLFILAFEVSSRGLNHLVSLGDIQTNNAGRATVCYASCFH